MAKGNPDLTKMIVEDVEEGVKEAHKAINKMNLCFQIPDITKTLTPIAFENKGKVTIRGERNNHLAFENATHKD